MRENIREAAKKQRKTLKQTGRSPFVCVIDHLDAENVSISISLFDACFINVFNILISKTQYVQFNAL